jgi:hypothetical protein
MDLILTDWVVSRIREDVYTLLDVQGDMSNDYHHVRGVEVYAKELCEQRHLDINIGLAIALMHDLGRIIGGVYGKNFKYLIDNGVLTIEESIDLELINDLHMAIGRLHDIVENRKILANYIKTHMFKLKHKHEIMVTNFYESRMSKEQKEIKRLIFLFRKRQDTSLKLHDL